MTTQTETPVTPGSTAEEKIQQLRDLFADAPEIGKRALENVLGELTSQVAEPRYRVESAGRVGVRLGNVSELTMIFPFAHGGAKRLRAFLQLLNGNLDGANKVGSLHDMRFVFLDNDTKLLFCTAFDGEWDPYIDDFATKIPTTSTSWTAPSKAGRESAARRRRTTSPAIRSTPKAGTSPTPT